MFAYQCVGVGDYEMVGSLFLVNTNLSRDDLDEFIEVTTVNIQCPHEDIYDMDSNGTNREKDPLCVVSLLNPQIMHYIYYLCIFN